MLSNREIIEIVDFFLSKHFPGLAISCSIDKSSPLNYLEASEHLAPQCHVTLSNQELRKVCSEFYSNIPTGIVRKECPFGVTLVSRRNSVEGQFTSIVAQESGFVGRESLPKTIRFSRLAKKNLDKLILSFEGHVFEKKFDREQLFGEFERIIETLLSGRVAKTIRMYAHQILTPLQGATNSLGGLKPGSILPSEEKKLIEKNLSEIDRLARNIHFLLTGAIAVTKDTLRKIVVHNQVQLVIDELSSLANQKKIKIHQGFNSGDVRVEAVPDLFEMAIRNLIGNAVKYSFEGDELHQRAVVVNYKSDEGYLVIMITNTGCLITQAEVESGSIFELNVRGVHSLDRGREGTGTGLYIVNEIAKAHKAEIEVSSNPISKTHAGETIAENTFTLKWPVYSPLIS